MPSSAMEAANSIVSEFFAHGTIQQRRQSHCCDKVTLKTVCGTYKNFILVANYIKSLGINSAMRQEFGMSGIDRKF